MAQQQRLQSAAQDRVLAFARARLADVLQRPAPGAASPDGLARGFPNLGNTCYINAVVQCLLHCEPFQQDLREQRRGASFMGDRLRELLIMRIGWTTGSDYEWTQHWRIALEQFGCSEQDLLAVRNWQNDTHFGEDERTLLAAVDALLGQGSLPSTRKPTISPRAASMLGMSFRRTSTTVHSGRVLVSLRTDRTSTVWSENSGASSVAISSWPQAVAGSQVRNEIAMRKAGTRPVTWESPGS